MLGIRVDRLAESDVKILANPFRMLAPAIAQFEVVDFEPACKVTGRVGERRMGGGVGSDDATVHAERRRNERIAEQQALHLRQREDAADLALRVIPPAGNGKRCPKDCFEDVLPFREVKKRTFGVCLDERVPGRAIRQGELTHPDAVNRRIGSRLGGGLPFHSWIFHESRPR